MSKTQSTRTHRCPDGTARTVNVKWDKLAQAYVQTEQCEACGAMFELFEGEA